MYGDFGQDSVPVGLKKIKAVAAGSLHSLALQKDGTVVRTLDCAGDADDVFYDAANRRVYVSGGEGAVSVVRQADADHYQTLGRTTTSPGARTALFVPTAETLYVAVPHRGGQSAELRPFEAVKLD